MTGFDGYLDDDETRVVSEAFSDAGLTHKSVLTRILEDNTDSLAIDMFDAKLSSPTELALLIVRRFNEIHNMQNGSIPLEQLLVDAIDQSMPGSNVDVFEQALRRVQGGVDRVRHVGTGRVSSGPMGNESVTAKGPTLVTATPDSSSGGSEFNETASALNTKFEKEAEIGASDETLTVNFLNSGALSAASVFKILIHHHMDGSPIFGTGDKPQVSSGTGWVIAKGMIITNHHVIDARDANEPEATAIDFKLQGEKANVRFDFTDKDNEPDGVQLESGSVLAFDRQLDYCVLRLPALLHNRAFLKLRIHGIKKRVDLPLRERVNVLQHPQGRPMRLGFRTNYVVEGTSNTLAYLTDTARGSSGSPVCDDNWSVAALHSGSEAFENSGIEILGRTIKRKNVGTPIPAIMQHLKNNFESVYDEIMQSQSELG